VSRLSEEDRFWAKVEKGALPDACWLWTAARDRDGYGAWFPRPRASWKAHRYSWTLRNGEIPEGLCVCHKCDVPSCVNPDHLFLGTRVENNADRDAKGRTVAGSSPGEKNPNAKLDEESVRAIRAAFAAGELRSSLSRRFSVSWTLVNFVVKRTTWKHIKGEES